MSAASIERVVGRRVWDSRGRPTVEAEIRLAGGAMGRAIAPAGAGKAQNEKVTPAIGPLKRWSRPTLTSRPLRRASILNQS